jgi:predicted nucleotidyltransferase
MHSVFTTYASSRFIDQSAVVEALRGCARQLKVQCADVVAVHLFRSFATRTATPRSDADVIVEINEADLSVRQQVQEAATDIFLLIRTYETKQIRASMGPQKSLDSHVRISKSASPD